jgi:hypothetical protein
MKKKKQAPQENCEAISKQSIKKAKKKPKKK